MMAAPEIITFGCRLNAFESDIIRRAAAAAGLADAVIVNTCAVTAEAERQARQAIRRARREHPGARIIVTGCAATLAPERYAALPEVDLVLDNDAKLRAESYRSPLTLPSPRWVPPLPWDGERLEMLAAQGTLSRLRERVARAARRVRAPPHPRLSAGAAGLRSSLHVLHHPLCARGRAGRCRCMKSPSRRAYWWLPARARSC